jgi:enamine deaminase RidA (YjgF/YER057c/UK114 family)
MKKGFISLVVSIFIVASISPAYGDITGVSSFSDILHNLIYWCLTPTTAGEGEDAIVAAREYVNSVWRTPGNCDGTVEVTYQSLSDAVISMNSSGIPCKIAMWRGAGPTGYVIKATGSIPICDGVATVDANGKYFTNISGAVFIAKNNTSGVVTSEQINSIKEILNNFYDLFNTNSGLGRSIYRIENAVSGLYVDIHNSVMGSIESLLTTCNTISTKLDTLTSVISNGKVLVDNSDVVSALYTDFASVMGILESFDTGSLDPTAKFPALTGLIAVSTATYELVQRIGFGIDDVVSAIQSIPAFDDTDIITAIQSIPAYDDSTLVSAVTTISDQITEQFGEYDSTYSFPNFSSSGQSAANNKTVSGVLPSAFTSINPGTRQLLYSPSGTLILPKRVLYNGGGDCKNVYCTPYIHQTYGLGYRLEFLFRFSRIQNTPRTETVQFPQVSFTDYSGETLTLYGHSGTVRVSPRRDTVSSYLYYFPRWDASGNWLGWSGQNDTFQFSSSSYEPSKRVYLTPPESGTYYIYGTSDTAIPVVYASRFTGFLQSQTDRVVNAVGSIPAPTDYTSQLTAVVEKLDALLAKSNETVVNVINDNTYVPGVLYLDDSNSAVDTTKDGVSLFGGLVRWLWKNVFDGAFDAADITKLDGLFYDPAAVAEEVPDGS